ncbi:MAG: Tetrahydromethanopterin S-methyltransferase subunit E [Methanosaeta sp. PtaB.Bin039]|nr:MAG: Tetrahydromethanopterin S-methyltransferase subunit E [Methanosaeta sp. PtaB.Bin039]OPY46148.1 MAG: Tetrahydromethanopterin S-methyltransferase subunit E [Methanosaeta sp. PtaU1.Bin028]
MDAFSMSLVAASGALALVAGASEDIESDVGSQSNPNSQVQLAAQVGFPHRIFNKAVSGEPPSNALYCALAASAASMLISSAGMPALFSLAIGASVAALFGAIFAVSAYMGRNSSQGRFNQWVYLDIIRSHTPTIMAHIWVTAFCISAISYIMVYMMPLKHPFPMPVVALIWGLAVGAVGSSVGDVHYGAEREFQNTMFGAGLNTMNSGMIVRKAEAGLRCSIENGWFCSKLGGPLTGMAFGLTVFLSNWITNVFDPITQPGHVIGLGLLIVLAMIFYANYVERSARRKYGPYPEYKGDIKP